MLRIAPDAVAIAEVFALPGAPLHAASEGALPLFRVHEPALFEDLVAPNSEWRGEL